MTHAALRTNALHAVSTPSVVLKDEAAGNSEEQEIVDPFENWADAAHSHEVGESVRK